MTEESKVRSSTLLFRRICAVILFAPAYKKPATREGWLGLFSKGAVRKWTPCRRLPMPASEKAGAYKIKPSSFSLHLLSFSSNFHGAYNMLVFGFKKSIISAVSGLMQILSKEKQSRISSEYGLTFISLFLFST